MKKLFKWGGIVLLVIIIIAIFSGNSSTTKQNKVATTQSTKTVKKEIVKVEINPFIKEFDDNQLAAEKKYKGKIIETSAYINNISEDIAGKPFLSLSPKASDYFGTSVKCNFNDKDVLTSLKNGEWVKVQGEFKSQDLGIIVLSGCKILK